MHWSTLARPEILAPFFFLVGFQLRAELTHIREILLPSFAALGGMVLPAVIYLVREPQHRAGWPIVTPTDIALVVAGTLILGKRISPALKTFLIALAIADDLFSLLIVAAKYSTAIRLSELFCTLGAVGLGALVTSLKFESPLAAFVNYLLLPAYVIASFVPLISAPGSVWGSHLSLSIALSRCLGKPLGILFFAWLASKAPRVFGTLGISVSEILVGGALAGAGLALSLVITSFTFGGTLLADQTKAGLVIAIPLSLISALAIRSLTRGSGTK